MTLALLLLICAGLSFAVYDRYQVEREVYERREKVQADLVREMDRQRDLESRVNYLDNEQGMEAEIRRHFDVALEGEQVVVLVGETREEAELTTVSTSGVGQEGFWRRWWPW
jgi:hypothetical protein